MKRVSIRNMLLVLLLFVLLACNISLAGDIIYVKRNGTGDGSSWADANGVLQDMIDSASSGDQIWVTIGTYRPTKKVGGSDDRYKAFQMKNAVEIYGGFPSSGDPNMADRDSEKYRTTLSGDLNGDDWGSWGIEENSYHVFYHPSGTSLTSSAVLDGFIIIAGNANAPGTVSSHNRGGGMHNSYCDPVIRNCTFSDSNSAEYGGGMYNFMSEPEISNCIFEYNKSVLRGGGVAGRHSDATFIDCTFRGNISGTSGGAMYGYQCDAAITNCEFSKNHAQNGGAIYNYDSHNVGNYLKITNCTFLYNDANDNGGAMYSDDMHLYVTNSTFWGNTSVNHGGGMYNYASNPQPRNCIFWANESGDTNTADQQVYYISGSDLIQYCVVEGGYGSSSDHNINKNPFLTAKRYPAANSPCIDAGSNGAVPGGITTDKDGRPRFIDDEETEDTGLGTAPIVDIGAYEYRAIYVDCNATGNNDGGSWEDAYVNLQNALKQSLGGDSLLVASGTYTPDSNERYDAFEVRSGTRIYGGYDTSTSDPNWDQRDADKYPTILSGDINTPGDVNDNCYHVVLVGFSGSIMACTLFDSLTITGGNANIEEDYIYEHKRGAGVYGMDLKFIDCTIRDNNSLSSAGGMYVDGSLEIIDSTICNNSSDGNGGGVCGGDYVTSMNIVDSVICDNTSGGSGGGIFQYNNLTVSGCSISNNSASEKGGGIWTYTYGSTPPLPESPLIVDNYFAGNSADKGGAMYSEKGEDNIVNCFFAGNDANEGGAIYCKESDANVINCAFTGNTAEAGAGMYHFGNQNELEFVNCSFAENLAADGNAIACDSDNSIYPGTIDINNCIFWDGGNEIDNNDVSIITINYSNIQGGWSGDGGNNINVDPCFVNPNGADDVIGTADDSLKLLSSSLCIDVGDNNSVFVDVADLDGDDNTSEPIPFDIDGNLRIDNKDPGVVDMGAYEFTINVADLNEDCNVDFEDFATMLNAWGTDSSVADIVDDGIVDEKDLALLCENWLQDQ